MIVKTLIATLVTAWGLSAPPPSFRRAPVIPADAEFTYAPVSRLLYGAPVSAAMHLDAFLHFYGPIRSQCQDPMTPSVYNRLQRSC